MSQVHMFSGKKEYKKNPKAQKEENVQIAICNYLRLQYPNVVFMCDLASGMRLPIHIAAKNKKMRSSRGLPDLFIAETIEKIEYKETKVFRDEEYKKAEIVRYSGLFLEIKRASIRLKNGGIAKSEHHDEQEAILQQLRKQGYKAEFGCGFEECKKIIDEYLN